MMQAVRNKLKQDIVVETMVTYQKSFRLQYGSGSPGEIRTLVGGSKALYA
jgi:hypothetical protein